MPVNHGTSAGGRMIPGQLQSEVRLQQDTEDPGAVEIVNALGISFLIARIDELLDVRQALVVRHRGESGQSWTHRCIRGDGFAVPGADLGRVIDRDRCAVVLSCLQQLPGEIFAPVDLAVFRNDFLIPNLTRG